MRPRLYESTQQQAGKTKESEKRNKKQERIRTTWRTQRDFGDDNFMDSQTK